MTAAPPRKDGGRPCNNTLIGVLSSPRVSSLLELNLHLGKGREFRAGVCRGGAGWPLVVSQAAQARERLWEEERAGWNPYNAAVGRPSESAFPWRPRGQSPGTRHASVRPASLPPRTNTAAGPRPGSPARPRLGPDWPWPWDLVTMPLGATFLPQGQG